MNYTSEGYENTHTQNQCQDIIVLKTNDNEDHYSDVAESEILSENYDNGVENNTLVIPKKNQKKIGD